MNHLFVNIEIDLKPLIDNFSAGSADYATFRPESPIEVFDFLYNKVNSFETASAV